MYDLCEDSAWALFPTIKLDRLDPATYEQSRNMNMRIGTWLREMSGRQNVQTVFFPCTWIHCLSLRDLKYTVGTLRVVLSATALSVPYVRYRLQDSFLHSSHEVSHSISIPRCWNAILCSAEHCLRARLPPLTLSYQRDLQNYAFCIHKCSIILDCVQILAYRTLFRSLI